MLNQYLSAATGVNYDEPGCITKTESMDKLLKPGRTIFAIGMIGLAILCFVSKDFIVGRPPAWPANFDCIPSLAYVSGTILILACAGILISFRGMLCASVMAVLIFILSI